VGYHDLLVVGNPTKKIHVKPTLKHHRNQILQSNKFSYCDLQLPQEFPIANESTHLLVFPELCCEPDGAIVHEQKAQTMNWLD
jgi:hypothetical protein